MTISTTVPRVVLNTNGATTVFQVPIQAYQAQDFLVTLTSPAGVETTLVLNSDYTMAAASSDTPPKWQLTTTLTYAPGYTIQAIVNPVQTQQTQYVANQQFSSAAVQQNFDRLTQMVQRLNDLDGRRIYAPDGDVSPNMALPPAATRALQYLGFDAGGNAIVVAALPGSQLTQPVFNSFLGQIVFNNAVAGGPAPGKFTQNLTYAGGTPGFVVPTFSVYTNTGAGVTDYTWGILSVLNNSAVGGQNVAIYGQGNRQTSNTGPTWGGVMEVRETVAINNPATGLIGLEVDNRSNGTDANFNRVGIDVVAARYNTGGVATVVSWGVRVQANNDANVTIQNGFSVWNANVGVAFDCGNALSVQSAALRMPALAPILFDTPGQTAMYWDGGALRFDYGLTSGTRSQMLRFVPGAASTGGGLAIAGSLGLNGVVLPTQPTGYGTPTGNAAQGSFNAATITLPNLAAGFAQMVIDLKKYGLVAP